MSAGEIVASLVQFAVVVGVTFGLLCLLTSYLRFQRMADRAANAGLDDDDGATSFQVQIARRLGSAHRDPEPFSIVLIRPAGQAAGGEDDLPADLSGRIHGGIRSRDTLLRLEDGVLGLVVGGGRAVGREVAGRILAQFAGDREPAGAIRIAVASYPENGDRSEALLAAAGEALAAGEGPAIRLAGDVAAAPDDRPAPTPSDPLAGVPAGQRKLLDPVTGVLREDHLGSVLHKRVAQSRKEGDSGSVLLLQVDHLDRYIDHYGPEGVETVLRHLGCYLQGAVREDDLLARQGEDQVVLILAGGPDQALVAARRIQAGVKELAVEHAGARLKITCSIGVASTPDHGGSARKLLDRAAAALDAARARGRDLCLVYEPGMRAAPRAAGEATSF